MREVIDEATGETIATKEDTMSLESKATKEAIKLGTKAVTGNWRSWLEPLRRMLTKRARKAEGRENIKPYAIALLILPLAGCGTINNALIKVDDSLYGSSTAGVLLPDGYQINPYVTDSKGDRQNIDGWQIKYEILPAAGHRHKEVKEVILQGNRASQSPVIDFIKSQQQTAGTSDNAAAAEQAIIDAAKAAGVAP